MALDGAGGRMDGPAWLNLVQDALDELRLDKAGSGLAGLARDGYGLVGAARVGTGLMWQDPACLDNLKAD